MGHGVVSFGNLLLFVNLEYIKKTLKCSIAHMRIELSSSLSLPL